MTNEKSNGISFSANYIQSAVADDAYCRLHIKTGSKQAHMSIKFLTSARFDFNTYLGATYSNIGTAQDGTSLTLFNQLVGGGSPFTSVYHNPTVTDVGDIRNLQYVDGESETDLLIPSNSDLLIVYRNVSGSASDLSVVLDWIESYNQPTQPIYALSLSALGLLDGETEVDLTPTFATATKSYTADVLFEVASIEITGTGASEDESTPVVKGLGIKALVVGENTFNIDVIKFGSYTPTRYTIVITRAEEVEE